MSDPEFGRPVEMFDALLAEGEAAKRTSETLRASIGAQIQSILDRQTTCRAGSLLRPCKEVQSRRQWALQRPRCVSGCGMTFTCASLDTGWEPRKLEGSSVCFRFYPAAATSRPHSLVRRSQSRLETRRVGPPLR